MRLDELGPLEVVARPADAVVHVNHRRVKNVKSKEGRHCQAMPADHSSIKNKCDRTSFCEQERKGDQRKLMFKIDMQREWSERGQTHGRPDKQRYQQLRGYRPDRFAA